MSIRKRLAFATGLIVLVVVVVAGWSILAFTRRNIPERFDEIRDHFMYGSFAGEARNGIPLLVWEVLPVVFEEHLPDRPGEGVERLGMVFQPESERPPGVNRPIGTSVREDPIPLVGLNCAICHTGTVRFEPDGERNFYLGMPAHQFSLESYLRFLFAAAHDPDFTPGVLLDAIAEAGHDLSWFEKQLYRHLVIPELHRRLLDIESDFEWQLVRPQTGPGRVDTFNPYKTFWNDKFPDSFDFATDDSIGTADFPSLWLQGPRDGMNLHWDGNNAVLSERNSSAAIGAGASEAAIEQDQLARIRDWIEALPPPAMPFERIDWGLVPAGKQIYDRHCASCHAFDGAEVGKVVPLSEIGTDRHRADAFDDKIAGFQNRLGAGLPWALSHFEPTGGYANMPLDGTWLRAPYLHNGSVPNLFYLLEPPANRPASFYRGYDVYDFDMVGFVYEGAAAEAEGFLLDTTLPGNGNGGHVYGTDLTRAEKDALIEYMKTL